MFEAAKQTMGGVPNVLRVLGNSAAALKAYLTLSDVLAETSFNAREREAIALTIAGANDCNYCASANILTNYTNHIADTEIDFPAFAV